MTRDTDVPDSRSATILISAAEPSADLHAAGLIRAYRAIDPGVRFVGIAGPKMRDAGCESLCDMTQHAAMLLSIWKVAPKALAAIRKCRELVQRERIDLAVVVDSPTMHLPLAKHMKRAGVGVLYYIAPQLWAWGEFRMKRLRSRVDRLAVILPFEEAYFRRHGFVADYVGNPLFDELENRVIDSDAVSDLRSKGKPLISIFPGSRVHVVEEVFDGQLDVAAAIATQFENAHFCISVANERVGQIITQRLNGFKPAHSLHRSQNGELFTASDLALIASGTTTLEAAYYHTPMIVMYNASRVGYHLLARWFINCPYYSLVNILADREIVPEFMPFYKSTRPIADAALRLLNSPNEATEMRQALAGAIDPMVKTGGAANTARIAREMIQSQTP